MTAELFPGQWGRPLRATFVSCFQANLDLWGRPLWKLFCFLFSFTCWSLRSNFTSSTQSEIPSISVESLNKSKTKLLLQKKANGIVFCFIILTFYVHNCFMSFSDQKHILVTSPYTTALSNTIILVAFFNFFLFAPI